MIVSVIPTTYCDNNCSYCYISKEDRENKNFINIPDLDYRLRLIKKKYPIENINIYGGEVSLFDIDKVQELVNVCHQCCDNVTVITNLSNMDILKLENCKFCTSVNPDRPDFINILTKFNTIGKDISVSSVVTEGMLKYGANNMMNTYQLLANGRVLKVELFRYINKDFLKTSHYIGNKDFAVFLKRCLIYKRDHKLNNIIFQNEIDIQKCLKGEYNPYSDSNIFIDPRGFTFVIDHDAQLNEYYSYISLENVPLLKKREINKFRNKCSKCKYLHHCYAEHYMKWKRGDYCCGLRELLKWYEEKFKNLHSDYPELQS